MDIQSHSSDETIIYFIEENEDNQRFVIFFSVIKTLVF